MRPAAALVVALLGALALPCPAAAQSDDDYFKGDEPPKVDKKAPPPGKKPSDDDYFKDDAVVPPVDKAPGAPGTGSLLGLTFDKLQLGGMMYLRFDWRFTDGEDVSDHPISIPSFVDLYLDARPNDRLRAFIRGRLSWNPTITSGAPAALTPTGDEVSVLLDELWLKLDIARVVYITIGQQHVRWGATRIWNPVEVINRTRRAPLQPFDERVGVPMVKLHFPVESLAWNFYVIGMLDDVTSLDRAGVAGRAEFVFSTVELGLVAAWRDGTDPRVGLDLSAGAGPVDLTAEVGLTVTGDTVTVQASVGAEYGIAYGDDDTLYLALEYFYNQTGRPIKDAIRDAFAAGVASGSSNPSSVFALPFFYIGEHYGAVSIILPAPGRWNDTSFSLSTLANFSDLSFITRFDASVKVLTWLTIQAYVAGHYGHEGELRLGRGILDGLGAFADLIPGLNRFPTQVVDVGLYLRLDI